MTNFLPLFPRTIFSLALCLTIATSANFKAFADDDFVTTFDEESEQLAEPTPAEDLGSPEGENIPGTEPLYDQAVTITQIQIEGNPHIQDTLILGAMETRPGSIYSKKRLKQDIENIYDLGYFTEKLKVTPIATRDGIHIKIEVEENPVVSDFKIEGNEALSTDDLKPLFGNMVGQPQNIKSINNGIKALEAAYKDKGYVLARVEAIDEGDNGEVILKVNEGVINKIRLEGNKKTKDYVFKRAMAQKEGKPYNEKTVSEDMKRIFSTQIVSDVRRVLKASAEKSGTYDLTLEVDEKKTGTVSLGGGADSVAGVFGSVGYSDPNFMGRGYNVSTMATVGSGVIGASDDILRRRTLQMQASFFNPSVRQTDNSLGVNVYGRENGSFNVPLGIERRYGGEVTWGRPVTWLKDWFNMDGNSAFSLALGGENIKLREGSTDSYLQNQFGINAADRKQQLDDGNFVYLSPTISNDTRDNRFNPTSGHYYTLSNRNALGLGTDSYANITANLRRYLRITDNMTLALNGQGGGTFLGTVPEFNQFRMGGSYTVRGYQEGGMGTGEHYLMSSIELRTKVPLLKKFKKYPIYDMTQLTLFTDAGALFGESPANTFFDRPGHGVSIGAGLRLNLPYLGPIRVDYAVPIIGKGRGINNVNFGVGQKF